MKENTLKAKDKIFEVAKSYSLKILFFKAVCFIAGIFVSKGSVFGHYYPFGLSFSASAPGKFFVPMTLGAALGYLFPLRLATSVRYISSLAAIVAVRWTLGDFKKIKNSSLYVPLIVFFSSLITGIAVNCAGSFDSSIILVSVLESLIAATASYFFDRSHKIILSKAVHKISYKELIYIAISIGLILFSAESVRFGSVSLGRVAASTVILIASYTFGVVGALIFGAVFGAIFGLSSLGFTHVSGLYAFSGMISGLCCGLGRIPIAITFLITQVLFSFQLGDATKIIIGLYESVFAVLLFLIIPKNSLKKLSMLLQRSNSKKRNIKNSIIGKLDFTSKFLSGVPKIINRVSENAFEGSSKTLKSSYEEAVINICKSCSKRGYCYGEYKEETSENLNSAVNNAMCGDINNLNTFSERFRSVCFRTDDIINTLNGLYEENAKKESEKMHICDIKNAADGQLSAVSSLLEELSSEINESENFDDNFSEKISKNLYCSGIDVKNIICRKNAQGKLLLEIELQNRFKNMINKRFCDIISETAETTFCKPIVVDMGESFRVQMCEKTKYKVEFDVTQHHCGGNDVCGDSIRAFEDGFGNFNVILSDGMGTGQLASEEGKVSSELMENFIKSGMGLDSSAKLVNSSLIINSKEEALSTLDVLSLNLFSGKAKFMKAGAPFTYILHGSEIKKLEFSSLPIGIFTDVSAPIREINLHEGDKILMLSDGATDIGEEWIKDILEGRNFSSVSEIASAVVDAAVNIRKSTHDDDITAIAVRISKNS